MAFSKVTDKSIPHRLELFGDPVVIWWDHTTESWAAMLDSCPHRLAPLSEGRVDEEGLIECPYHGWSFDRAGTCTKVPQAKEPSDPRMLTRCGGTAFAVAEKQGIVWLWGEPLNFSPPDTSGASRAASGFALPDESAIPTCEALDDDRFVWIDVSRDMPYSADMLLENVLDSSHVPFTHHQTISRRENAVPLELRLRAPVSAAGFEGVQAAAPPLPSAGVSSAVASAATERTSVFRAPTYMHHRIRTAPARAAGAPTEAGTPTEADFARGFETWTVAYATPTGPGRCRLLARFPFRFPEPARRSGLLGRLLPTLNVPKMVFQRLPDWVQHMGQLRVLDDDNVFLPLQERAVGARPGGWRANYVMPTTADAYVSAYRRWFDAAGPPPHAPHAVDTLQAALSAAPLDKAALLDRHSQHTAHCTACSGALANARTLANLARRLLLAMLALTPWVATRCAPAAAAAAAQLAAASGARSVVAAIGALVVAARPLLAAGTAAAMLGAGRSLALSIERRLTSGLSEYPPPRNQPAGSKMNARELRTVEQGRRS